MRAPLHLFLEEGAYYFPDPRADSYPWRTHFALNCYALTKESDVFVWLGIFASPLALLAIHPPYDLALPVVLYPQHVKHTAA